MLIVQGRKWDSFRRTRGRGLHCPTVRNSSPPHHQCSPSNVECQRALSFRNTIQAICLNGGAVIIEVILLPECGHLEPAILLEKWTLQQTEEASTMSGLSLMQAVDSMIHFSQLCSWWSSTNGSQPKNIQYKVYEQDDPDMDSTAFAENPVNHWFMVSNGVKIQLKSLPRQAHMPELHCRNCSINAQKMEIESPSRGRNFMHRRATSRHSSASSDSLSPSVSRMDQSPFGSPLLSSCFRTSLSSSSSSRGSSRTASPCSRSPSERSLILTFESQRQKEESGMLSSDNFSRNDSGFMDNASRENPTINQDEELANQLDSLSDSDLSDDYVIDGPVGSPGLVGTPIASPDDSRVQMLQSTFAGFHCRHPTFNRLMGDVVGPGNRTRHSSLDSAVSNLERLDLQTRRQLSRTSSDGQDFENFRERSAKKDSEKEFFIRDMKKRHKFQDSETMDLDEDTPRCTLNNTFYASFRREPESAWCEDLESTPILDFCDSLDDFSPSFNDFKILQPQMNSTPTTVGFVTMPRPESLHFPFPPFGGPTITPTHSHCESSTSSTGNCPSLQKVLQEDPKFALARSASAGDIKTARNPSKSDDTPLPRSSDSKTLSSRVRTSRTQQNDTISPTSLAAPCPQPKRDASPNATSRNMNINCNAPALNEKKKDHALKVQPKLDSDGNVPSSSVLLRSPPSKLRILPSHCVEKNYLHNPPRQTVHKLSAATQCGPARRLQFNQLTEKATCTSPAPIRRNNAVRFEFDEDMPKLNQRSSRSICRGKCMKKNDIIIHNHGHLPPTHRLLGSFEESIIHNRLEVLGSVDGFHAQLGASGSFCPTKVKLPVPVRFFHVSDDNAPSPYMGTMSLKGKECGKRGYHIPRKGTIQLTLFNPNNSVVKVFVILYDVNDMPPGHRTFLRHRIYSKPTAAATSKSVVSHTGIKSKIVAQAKYGNHENRPNSKYLRYFVNLWLESSKTNKIYIHGDVKILFSLASNEWDSGNTFELETNTEFPKNPKYSSKR